MIKKLTEMSEYFAKQMHFLKFNFEASNSKEKISIKNMYII